MAQFSSHHKLLPSREVQESLLNCVEEGTKILQEPVPDEKLAQDSLYPQNDTSA
jgi:hypothetical protein